MDESPAPGSQARSRRRLVGNVLVVAVGAALLTGVSVTMGHRDGSTGTVASAVPLDGHRASAGAPSWTAWPQAQHDAQHTGAATVNGPRNGHVRWSRDLGADVTPGPVVAADGTIYAPTNAGVLHAVDPRTGRDVWTLDTGQPYGSDLSTSPAVLRDGVILWPGPGNRLLAVSPEGKKLWDLAFDGQPTSPAVTPEGDVYVGDTGGAVVMLHPSAAGPQVGWRRGSSEQSYGSVAVAPDGRTVYQTTASGVRALRDGHQVWRWRVPEEIVEVGAAVSPDGVVVVGTNDPFQYGLDGRDGHVRWRHRRGFWTYSSPGVTRDGLAYFGDHSNTIKALDATTGHLAFCYQGDQADDGPGGIGIWTSVLVDARHSVYVGTRQGLVYGVAADGHRMWQVDAGVTVDSYPALTADGTLVVGTTGGRLLAIADD